MPDWSSVAAILSFLIFVALVCRALFQLQDPVVPNVEPIQCTRGGTGVSVMIIGEKDYAYPSSPPQSSGYR